MFHGLFAVEEANPALRDFDAEGAFSYYERARRQDTGSDPERWQVMECEATSDILAGRVRAFDSVSEFLADLDKA